MKNKTFYLICLALLIILASCKNTTLQLAATEEATRVVMTPVSQLQETDIFQPFTLTENTSKYENGDVVDGLLFRASVESKLCRKIGEPYKIALSFVNVSMADFRIINEFSFSRNRFGAGGNITPFITDSKGNDVHSIWDNQLSDYLPSPSSSYITIPIGKTLNVTTLFFFPDKVLESWPTENEIVVTPTPETYSLKFLYIQAQQDIGTWHGGIESNLIEICISN